MGEMDKPTHIALLEQWMKSYRPAELFDTTGKLQPGLAALAPQGACRMNANPHANGGMLPHDLHMPDFRAYAVDVTRAGAVEAETTRVQGQFLRDVLKWNPTRSIYRSRSIYHSL